MNNFKKIVFAFWLLIIGGLISLFIYDPNLFTADSLVVFVNKFKFHIFISYFFVSIVRGFFLIPSTPFVIGGGLLFPDKLFLVLVISMLGVLFSAILLYYFSNYFGFDKILTKKFPKHFPLWVNKLNKRNSFFLIMGWSFLPVVPTDLICCIGGIVKTPIKYVVGGVFCGELILNVIYLFFTSKAHFLFM